jgi:hypothetical protein
MADERTKGSCLCGAVEYETVNPATEVTHCHCSMCRKQHGAAFATYAGYLPEDLRLLRGEDCIVSYASAPHVERRFCRICGSSLFWADTVQGRRIWVAVGTIDGGPGRAIDGHIFVGSKAPWYEITDDLPQFEEFMTSS